MRHGGLTIDQMLEVAEHGADAGWLGLFLSGYRDTDCQFENAMAWYALEKAAQELANQRY